MNNFLALAILLDNRTWESADEVKNDFCRRSLFLVSEKNCVTQ